MPWTTAHYKFTNIAHGSLLLYNYDIIVSSTYWSIYCHSSDLIWQEEGKKNTCVSICVSYFSSDLLFFLLWNHGQVDHTNRMAIEGEGGMEGGCIWGGGRGGERTIKWFLWGQPVSRCLPRGESVNNALATNPRDLYDCYLGPLFSSNTNLSPPSTHYCTYPRLSALAKGALIAAAPDPTSRRVCGSYWQIKHKGWGPWFDKRRKKRIKPF